MMDGQQAYQWPQPYFGAEPTRSVDSARASKSKSGEKEPKNHHKGTKPQAINPAQMNGLNQFVPVYMIPPGFQGHPGAFNAALAAHAASQGQTVPNMYQMPTYGHFNQGYLPYGYPAAAPQPNKGYVAQYGSYSGSDYQTNSSAAGDSSHRNSKSSDNASSKRNSRSTTSKDSARHSVEDGARKNSIRRLPPTKNTKKVQSTFSINISKTQLGKPIKITSNSNSRSHSIGSDLSAGCSASACAPIPKQASQIKRSCSHDSDDSTKIEALKSMCCSTDCDHVGPIFETMRKFSNNTDFKKPDAELTKKLIELIEFYLSDEYLAKDKYLLRQIRCKSEGYISIKLMTSFKKVKKLTRDWRAVRFALLQTPNLIVSDEGFRVKRATQLPENLRKPRLLSSVVTIRLTEEMSSVDAITNLFAKHGEIGLVRILKPGKEIPSDLRNYATQVPDIGKSTCAVVDFEQSESALQAVRCLKDELAENKMRLALLGPRVRRTLYKQDTKEDDEEAEVSQDSKAVLDSKTSVQSAFEQGPESDEGRAETESLTSTPSTSSSYKNIVIKAKSVRVDSNDSGNLDESSGNHSNDEDLNKAVVFHDDSSNNNTVKVTSIKTTLSPLSSKMQIFREPEGPGSNNAGFGARRQQFAH